MDQNYLAQASFDDDTAGEEILVASINNQPVGFISIWLPDSFLHHLYILPSHQRQGIGKALIQKAQEMVEEPLTLKCLDLNEGAMNFYLNNGWKKVSQGTSNEGKYTLLKFYNFNFS